MSESKEKIQREALHLADKLRDAISDITYAKSSTELLSISGELTATIDAFRRNVNFFNYYYGDDHGF
jgi:hypothetical protein